MSDYTRKEMYADLSLLYEAASSKDGWQKDQAKTLIDVGEYNFALDWIAYAYLNASETMPPDLFRIFEKLAVKMKLEGDPEFEGVATLRASTKA